MTTLEAAFEGVEYIKESPLYKEDEYTRESIHHIETALKQLQKDKEK